MITKTDKFIDLLTERYTKEFIDTMQDMYWKGWLSYIPKEIRCKVCSGVGGEGLLANYKSCPTCCGKGIPPIPNYEIYGPDDYIAPSKGKK